MSERMPAYGGEQRYWDARGAADYVSLSPADQARVTRWIDWHGGGRALDLGGGSGMVSRLLAGAPGTGCVCLDISHAMLRHAQVPAVQASALALPFADGSFDLVVAAAFVHHLPGAEPQLLAECRRVLKPGGRLAGYDPSADCLQNRIFMGAGPLRLKFFSPDERPVAPERLRAQVLAAGFRDFRYERATFRNARLTPFEAVQRYLLNPLARGPLARYLERWFFWTAQC